MLSIGDSVFHGVACVLRCIANLTCCFTHLVGSSCNRVILGDFRIAHLSEEENSNYRDYEDQQDDSPVGATSSTISIRHYSVSGMGIASRISRFSDAFFSHGISSLNGVYAFANAFWWFAVPRAQLLVINLFVFERSEAAPHLVEDKFSAERWKGALAALGAMTSDAARTNRLRIIRTQRNAPSLR